MGIHAQKKQEEKSQSQSKEIAQLKNEGSEANDFLDLRPEAETPKKMQQLADNSFRSSKLSSLQSLADSNVKTSMPIQGKFQTVQKSGLEDEELLQGKFQTIQKVEEEEELIQGKFISPPKEENTTGLPDALKSGVESLSGVSLNDVKVYRNSDKPAQLQAHAYAQGTDIHLGPGQDQHLPHEAWHVVQQKQGRVKPTVKVNGNVPVNDSPSLEEEATTMGQKAMSFTPQFKNKPHTNASIKTPTAQLWSFPWSKKKEEEKPKDIKQIVSEHKKIGQKESLKPQPPGLGGLLNQSLAKRRRAITGEESDAPKTQKSTIDAVPRAEGFNQDFQKKLGGMISTKKNEAANKKRDAFESHALNQSAFADQVKPGEENSWGTWFKSKKNAMGRGLGNFKESAKNKFGNTWLGKKMGISGLNKDERNAADAKALQIKRGASSIDAENPEALKFEGQAGNIGKLATGGKFLAGKVPVLGKLLKSAIDTGASGAKMNRHEKAQEAYEQSKVTNPFSRLGANARAKKQAHSKEQEKLNMQANTGGMVGAAVDILNPLDSVDQAVQEVSGGKVSLPSFQSLVKGAAKFLNRKKQKQLKEQAPGIDSDLALTSAIQQTGDIDRAAFNEHKSKNKGLMSELNSKFDDGSSIKSRLGISQKEDPKLKPGILKHVQPKAKKEKQISIGGMLMDMELLERMSAKDRGESHEVSDEEWD